MKLNKKKVALAAVAVCLVAILSMGTLAWFNASQEMENIFHVSTEDDDQTPDFGLDLFENVVDPDTGKNIDTNNDGVIDDKDTTDDGNTYNNIISGDVLDKNPTVKNTGAYDQYVRMIVTITNADEWVTALAKYNLDLDDVIVGYDDAKWHKVLVDTDATDGTVQNVYYYEGTLAPNDTATLFTAIKIPKEFTQEDMKYVGATATENGLFTMKIVAHAIQSEHTGTNALEAFANCWKPEYN